MKFWWLPFLWLTLKACPSFASETVTIGVYVQDIQDLDLKTHSFMTDFYVWFKWRDKALSPNETIEFMNPYELWGHTRKNEFEKNVHRKDGQWYQVIRNQGRFSNKLSMEDYPFDSQTLVIEFEDSSDELTDLKYALDQGAIVINPKLRLPGFQIGKPTISISEYEYPTNFGAEGPNKVSRYSRVRVEIPIVRPMVAYALKLLLPIFCVVVCACLMFLFHPRYIDVRVGIGITALLTIVALQITLNEDLPQIDYLILMDKIYIASYLFVIAGIWMILKSTRLFDAGQEAPACQLDRVSLQWILGTYGLGVAWVIGYALLIN